jgi:hypothetical protein
LFDWTSLGSHDAYMDPAFGNTVGGLLLHGGPQFVILSQDLTVNGTADIKGATLVGPGALIANATILDGGTIDTNIRVDAGKTLEVKGIPLVRGDIINNGTAVSKMSSRLQIDGASFGTTRTRRGPWKAAGRSQRFRIVPARLSTRGRWSSDGLSKWIDAADRAHFHRRE